MSDFSDEARADFARKDGVQVRRVRRSPPRLPAGTLRIRGNGADGCIPITHGDFLTERDRALFCLLNGELMNVIRYCMENNLPVPVDFLEAMRRAAPAVFGCDPDDAYWLVPFLGELEAGRSERLALESREAGPGTIDLRPLAEEVIVRTLRRVQRLAPSIGLPPWLSGRLVALLLKRFSYTRGGGANGSLTKESIRRLLADPRQLSKYLRAEPGRARVFANELCLLDALHDAPKHQTARLKPTLPDLVDDEHATTRERRAARAARNTRSSLATIDSGRIVLLENGFVGVRNDASVQWLERGSPTGK